MGKKKKRRNKQRKQTGNTNLPLAKVLSDADLMIQAGKARDAITLLKAALKTHPADEKVRKNLYRAYQLRKQQLLGKDMFAEASVVEKNAFRLLPEPDGMTEVDMLALLDAASPGRAISACTKYLSSHQPSPMLERKIAELMLTANRWDLVDAVPPDSPLARDVVSAQKAAALMDEGHYHAALSHLQSIPRHSPYATQKILCRALACFYRKEDHGMQRLLNMIPVDSRFGPLVERLQQPEQMPCLWARPFCSPEAIPNLLKQMTTGRLRTAASNFRAMAATIFFPDDPSLAVREMLILMYPLIASRKITADRLGKAADLLLSQDETTMIISKIGYYQFRRGLADTIAYIKTLNTEFRDPGHAQKARSMILADTVSRLKMMGENGASLFLVPRQEWPLIGVTDNDPDLIRIEMLVTALDLDPTNRSAVDMLIAEHRPSRKAKTLVEKGLTDFMHANETDPHPCLELAALYYQKNAFRKAENILKEARRRAPHDSRVKDRHTLSLLISADRRLKKNKKDLAAADIEAAELTTSERLRPVVIVKGILLALKRPRQMSLFDQAKTATSKQWTAQVRSALKTLSPIQSITALGLLALEIPDNADQFPADVEKTLKNLFRSNRKEIACLTSAELRRILTPLGSEFEPLYRQRHRVGVYLSYIPRILTFLDHGDFIRLLDELTAEGLYEAGIKEITRRLKRLDEGVEAALLQFYQLTFRHFSGELLFHPDRYQAIVDNVPPDRMEPLRAASRRLAPHAADGALNAALSDFDFDRGADDILDLEDDEDDSDYFDGEALDMPFPALEGLDDIDTTSIPDFMRELFVDQFIDYVEELMDHIGARGMPAEAIHAAREEMNVTGLRQITRLFSQDEIEDVSREAWEFMFGKS